MFSQNRLHVNHLSPPNRPPSQCGSLGEQLAAIVLSLQFASANDTKAADEWDEAREKAAKQWRSQK